MVLVRCKHRNDNESDVDKTALDSYGNTINVFDEFHKFVRENASAWLKISKVH